MPPVHRIVYPITGNHHIRPETTSMLDTGGQDIICPDHQETAPIIKKRRGRLPRQTLLTESLLQAVATFTSSVGAPVLQPEGFRDISGWLDRLANVSNRPVWQALCFEFLTETRSTSLGLLVQMKRDVVQEIIRRVVKRKPHESSKLVSTNARRQCAIPPSGHSLMTIFETSLIEYSSLSSSQWTRPVGRGSHGGTANAPVHPCTQAGLHGQANEHKSGGQIPTCRTHSHDSGRYSRSIESTSSKSSKPSSRSSRSTQSTAANSGGQVSRISSMDISSLLTNDSGEIGGSQTGKQHFHYQLQDEKPSARPELLPSLTQMDAHLRARHWHDLRRWKTEPFYPKGDHVVVSQYV